MRSGGKSVMPMDRSLYPTNWKAITLAIKQEANWCCEACGRPCRQPKEAWIECLKRLNCTVAEAVVAKPGQFVLTTAHLNHQPSDCRRENLRAWCAPCHGRYDLQQMKRKQHLKCERHGQLRLSGL